MAAASPLAAALAALLAAEPPPGAPPGPDAHGQVPFNLSEASDAAEPLDPPPRLEPWSPEPDPTAFPPEPEPEPEASAPEPPPSAPAPAPPPPGLCHGSRPCKRLLALGGVAAVLGAGTIAAGVVLTTRRDHLDPHDPTTLISYRPIGGAALAVGTGLLTTWILTLLAAIRAGRLAGRPSARSEARAR